MGDFTTYYGFLGIFNQGWQSSRNFKGVTIDQDLKIPSKAIFYFRIYF